MAKGKRYHMEIPAELFDELQALADKNDTTVADLLRRFIKLGLLAAQTEDGGLYVREGDEIHKLVLI